MTTVSEELGADQRAVLQLIYYAFRQKGTWAIFDDIDRPLRKVGIDPVAVIQTIPRTLIPPFQAGRAQPISTDVLHLTLEGIAACEGGAEDVERFLRLLPWFADKELNFMRGIGPDAQQLKVTSAEVKEFLGLPDDADPSLSRLYEILVLERWGWGGGGVTVDGDWYVWVTREVSRFAQVQTLADYLVAKAQRAEEQQAAFAVPRGWRVPFAPAEPPQEVAVESTYVDEGVVRLIEEKSAESSWNCDKLLQLIRELNVNFANTNTYSAYAILRAILDHVPPILGYPDFTQVANNRSWSRTDKPYIKRLLDFKLQGDDALHRPISRDPDLLRFEDLPPGTWLNRLLLECANNL